MNEPLRNPSESSVAIAQPGDQGKIPPAGAKMEIKAMVGLQSSIHHYSASETSLRKFCEAVGARYRDEAPPTFMTVFRMGEFELLERMGVALKSVLHADQEYRYESSILPGDEIAYQTTLTRAFEKTGSSGPMRFFVFDTEIRARRADGAVVVGYSKTTLIVR